MARSTPSSEAKHPEGCQMSEKARSPQKDPNSQGGGALGNLALGDQK